MLALDSLGTAMSVHRSRIVRIAAAALAGFAVHAVAADSMVTVVRNGSGSGTVTASSGAIDCGGACGAPYADGTMLTLTAAPAAGSQFTGWLGPCTGGVACTFTVNGATTAFATFAPAAIGPPRLDPDGTASSDAYTDGLLILRYLFGWSGPMRVASAVGHDGTRPTDAQIGAYLDNIKPALDIDGNGQADALTDGLLILRYLLGLRGAPLIVQAVGPGAMRTTAAEIQPVLQSFFAPVVIEPPLFSGSFTAPDRAVLANLPLPPMVGRPGIALLVLRDATLYFDPAERTPVSAAAECAAVVLSCYTPGERNLAGCFANVPQCATSTPWVGNDPMCCPSACLARYQELLVAGESGPVAFAKSIFRAPSCMPGVAGYPPPSQP